VRAAKPSRARRPSSLSVFLSPCPSKAASVADFSWMSSVDGGFTV